MEVSGDHRIKVSDSPLTGTDASAGTEKKLTNAQKKRNKFFKRLPLLWGFRKSKDKKAFSGRREPIDFVKVDVESDMRVAQGKMPRIFSTKMSKTLDSLFNAWTSDVYDTYTSYEDRLKRLAELEFAILNDPFLGMAADLYADEASQIDSQDVLINIDCADARMKQKMEDLLDQWGVTQNRVRSIMYTLAWAGDGFWSAKITQAGVRRINPINVHQVTERLEFDPVQVAAQLALNNNMIAALQKDAKLRMMLDTLESEDQSEFSDMFDKKLFGFVINGNMVVPPWNIVHFRLNADQSEFYPMGKSLFLKALAPFRQYNATMTLQSIARIASFPITTYQVAIPPGTDSDEVFAKVEEAREQYDNLGESGNNSETMSVNTRIWMPKDLMEIEMHSPTIDINAIGDLEMYQDRVATASGVPKGYLSQEWGGWQGSSAISLIEQFKPFARRVFTIQSAFLEGLSNLFRIHFAITGEFDYREPFVLSMKFPNEETSEGRQKAKSDSLEMSKTIIDMISSIIGAINDPLPQEVIQDILSKFSFLNSKDIKKWIKPNPLANKQEPTASDSEGLSGGGELGGGAIGGGGAGGFEDTDLDLGGESGTAEAGAEGEPDTGEEIDLGTEGEGEAPAEEEPTTPEEVTLENSYASSLPRIKELTRRYSEAKSTIYEEIMKQWSRFDEVTIAKRHYKYTGIPQDMELMMNALTSKPGEEGGKMRSLKETVSEFMGKYEGSLSKENRVSWNTMKEELQWIDEETDTDGDDIGEEDLDINGEEFSKRKGGDFGQNDMMAGSGPPP